MRTRTRLSLFLLLFLLPLTFLITACDNSSTDNGKLSAEQIYEQISPSVVSITAESSTFTSSGTGFFYNNGSTVVTNYHVIEGAQIASIKLSNGKEYSVKKVLGYDKNKDIAILQVDYNNGKPLTARTSKVKTGEKVYAIGNSLGFLEGSFSEGIISTAERELDGNIYIQTTASVTNGNSGGPLVDEYGYVIGIVSAGFGDGLDLNLVIPISQVSNVNTSNPIELADIISVEWISDRQIWHQDENNRYVLVFTLADANKTPIAVSGMAIITIVNDKNEILYEKARIFDTDDFNYWNYNNGSITKYQATIYIKDSDIAEGKSANGTIKFTVEGEGYYFSESTLTISNLPVHVHEYSLVDSKTPSCTSTGSKTYKCLNCESSYTDFIDKLEHDYKVIFNQNASCKQEGKTIYKCSTCNDEYTQTSGKTGHNLTTKSFKDSTCTVSGSRTYACVDCSYENTEEVPKKTHNYSEATCTTPKTCTSCGGTEGYPLGHTESLICTRCNENLFEPIIISGKGETFIRNINLPKGKYLFIIETPTGDFIQLYINERYIGYNNMSQDTYSVLSVTNSSNVTNGYIKIKADDEWIITIEAVGN